MWNNFFFKGKGLHLCCYHLCPIPFAIFILKQNYTGDVKLVLCIQVMKFADLHTFDIYCYMILFK